MSKFQIVLSIIGGSLVILVTIWSAISGLPNYVKTAIAESDVAKDVKILKTSTYCISKELRATSVRNEIKEIRNLHGKNCQKCDENQRDNYMDLLEEQKTLKEDMKICK
jgi:hypothetical protein